ncbi:TPA: hypothetical protein ACX6S2_003465 [Photobacterium damselae]
MSKTLTDGLYRHPVKRNFHYDRPNTPINNDKVRVRRELEIRAEQAQLKELFDYLA